MIKICLLFSLILLVRSDSCRKEVQLVDHCIDEELCKRTLSGSCCKCVEDTTCEKFEHVYTQDYFRLFGNPKRHKHRGITINTSPSYQHNIIEAFESTRICQLHFELYIDFNSPMSPAPYLTALLQIVRDGHSPQDIHTVPIDSHFLTDQTTLISVEIWSAERYTILGEPIEVTWNLDKCINLNHRDKVYLTLGTDQSSTNVDLLYTWWYSSVSS